MNRNSVKWLLFLGINALMLVSTSLLRGELEAQRIVFFAGSAFSIFTFLFCEFSRKFYLSELLIVVVALNLEMLVIFLGYQRLTTSQFLRVSFAAIFIIPITAFFIIDKRRPKEERILERQPALIVQAQIELTPQEKRGNIVAYIILNAFLLAMACLFIIGGFSFGIGVWVGLLALIGLISNWRAYSKLNEK